MPINESGVRTGIMQDGTTKTLGLPLMQKDVSLGYVTQPPLRAAPWATRALVERIRQEQSHSKGHAL
jgi:hypothetical protein